MKNTREDKGLILVVLKDNLEVRGTEDWMADSFAQRFPEDFENRAFLRLLR